MKKLNLLFCLLFLVFGSISAKPITITKTGGRVYSSVTENPSDCTKQYKFTCGTNANATCFTLTYDDGTEALGNDTKPKYLKEGSQETPIVIQISDEKSRVEVEGNCQYYEEHNLMTLQGDLYRVFQFSISND